MYLLLLSMFSTSGVELRNFSGTLEEDLSSYNYYLTDSWQVCLIVLTVTATVAWLARRRLHDAFWEGLEKYRWLLYLLFLTAGLLFIGFTRLRPVSDSGKVLEDCWKGWWQEISHSSCRMMGICGGARIRWGLCSCAGV